MWIDILRMKEEAVKLHADSVAGSVRLGEIEVGYHDTGAPGDGRAPIVLVHGTGGSTEAHYRTVYPMLAARHRVIGVDAVVDAVSQLSDLVHQVVAVIEARSPGVPVHLVGYSLGAVVAAALAGRQPVLVKTLTLLAGWITTDKQQRLRNHVWQTLFSGERRPLQEFQTLLAFSSQFLRTRADQDLEALISSRTFRNGVDREMQINYNVDIREDVERITAPTLVVGASEDQMVPIRHSYELLGGIENARLAEVDAGHAVTTERPAQVFMLIDDFVRTPDGVPAGATVEPLMA
ncbi:Putative aminoacrylate hydrolase RutD [Gulosibacter molinativorax]|nr:Putative aminoacrylate hydrolase RutD [Gulosibacter molinativorax]